MGSKASENLALDELRELLLNPEKQQIQNIQNRLDDPMTRAREISQSLADAISLSIRSSTKLSRVIQPVIDESIKISVKNNPKAMADAIFPALGPGIRKAISATFLGMIQSLNHILNHSFSIQGIKWRFEAFRTRKPFAEIVLLHTLVFQVEQIFLIHRESGIVLDHVIVSNTIGQDPDLVSGMLTAIQDFVNDSFDIQDDLETLRIGSDKSIWIEKGEYALIAAVIRGTPPIDLRIKYRELIEEIHVTSGKALEKFEGDPLPFSIFREQLKEGLQFQEKKNQKHASPLLWCLLFVLLSLFCLWGFNTYKTHQLWTHYLNRIKSQKGLVILSEQKKSGKYQISGLRDPLSKDPLSLLQEEEKNLPIESQWTTFYSLEPELILERALQRLAPPSTIRLNLSGNILHAEGQASQDWIDTFDKTGPTLPGVDGIDLEQVSNIDMESMTSFLNELVQIELYFESNTTRLVKGQEALLDRIFDIIKKIQTLQFQVKQPVQIALLGHTDSAGTEKINQKLSRDRAEKIFNHLILNGIHPSLLTISGVGTKVPLKEEIRGEDRQYNRAVTFKTFYLP